MAISLQIKKARIRLLTDKKLKEKAQMHFNDWIRKRDENKGCISCGAKVEHAGHYFSSGHFNHLTFNEDNVHGQCLRCNKFLHGNLIYYRFGLVERYGDTFVRSLEAKGKPKKWKWDRIELEQIILKYWL